MNRQDFDTSAAAAAASRLELFGPRGPDGQPLTCKIGAPGATAVPIPAYCSAFRDDQQAGAGGFGSLATHTARYLKEGHPTPRQGHLFYDGHQWFTVGPITSSDLNPEWVLELEPLNHAERAS